MPPPENPPEDAPVILEGQDAIDLWQKGVEDWNKWVTQNPHADVDFSDADFSPYDPVSFIGFHFPNGDISFVGAKFGDGKVNFAGARFGNGDVNFDSATFGKGNISFFLATFGNGDVSFEGATFGKGDVSFKRATFSKGDLSFNHVTFGDGDVNFFKATFGDGDVSFVDATFGKGKVAFRLATFEGRFILLGYKNTEDITDLSFLNCHFKSTITIGAALTCVPDLCGTIVSAHVDLGQLAIIPKTRSREDAGKYRRLKELAEQNRDHEAALRFFAAERRFGRWVKVGNPWRALWSYLSSVLDLLYDGLSNYGQSIGRPCAALFVLIGLSGYLYTTYFELFPHWGDALLLAAAESIPFLTTTAIIPVKTPDKAILDTLGWPFHLWHLAYQIVSFILLFLIGIGLRNRFRL